MNPADFGRVAVFMGGWSAEREVSLKSGNAVYKALLASGVDTYLIDVDKNIAHVLDKERPDYVFNILHGRGGEDGTIQALLDLYEIPYTGSGVLASALSMDKVRTKQLWYANGLQTPDYFVVTNESELEAIKDKISGTVMVKPAHEGSSIGISKVSSPDQLRKAWEYASQYDEIVLIESFIDGNEYSVSILNGKALPAIRLQPKAEFYDYNAKYLSDDTVYHCPCGLDENIEAQLKDMALAAFNVLGCRGWGRVDFMVDKEQKPWLIENNTLPGMTDHSLVPMAAKAVNISFEELVLEILTTAVR